MPGAYTHITIVRLLTAGNALKSLKLPEKARMALMDYSHFCHMGAMSPDYPYLRLMGNKEAAEYWANSMHHKYSTLIKENIFHIGINYLKELTGDEQSKCFAWFLGYASHITADVTCHPVTNLLVGDYEADNQITHRVSEMHQDVYIFKTRVNGDVRKSEHIKNVVGLCHDPKDKEKIDSHIEKMWNHILLTTFPDIHAKFELNIHGWHNSVQLWLDDIGEELSVIPSRHIRDFFSNEGISYPRYDEINLKQYIDNLKTPKGEMSYDQIFDYAKSNVTKVWMLISNGIFLGEKSYEEKLKIWNLDTGQEVRTPIVMWEDTL